MYCTVSQPNTMSAETTAFSEAAHKSRLQPKSFHLKAEESGSISCKCQSTWTQIYCQSQSRTSDLPELVKCFCIVELVLPLYSEACLRDCLSQRPPLYSEPSLNRTLCNLEPSLNWMCIYSSPALYICCTYRTSLTQPFSFVPRVFTLERLHSTRIRCLQRPLGLVLE